MLEEPEVEARGEHDVQLVHDEPCGRDEDRTAHGEGCWEPGAHTRVFGRDGPLLKPAPGGQCSMVTSVPIGVYGQTFLADASGSSTQPRLWGVPKEARLKACSASPPLK